MINRRLEDDTHHFYIRFLHDPSLFSRPEIVLKIRQRLCPIVPPRTRVTDSSNYGVIIWAYYTRCVFSYVCIAALTERPIS